MHSRCWCWRLLFLDLHLLFLDEIDNEVLIVADEVVCQAFIPQIVQVVFPPFRIKGVQRGKFRLRLA
jgi:hypothetical protein